VHSPVFYKSPTLLALAAIALWSSLALLGTLLSHIPPFLLTGIALLVGGVPAWPFFRQWRVSWAALALGVYGLFGFHFFLFMALRHAPAVEANLVNYLWPLGMVLMAPVFLPGVRLSATHLLAAFTGFAGAAIAILGDTLLHSGLSGLASKGFSGGYLAAAVSAFIWASYSLMGQRMSLAGRGFPTAAIGLFGLVSGVLSLLCHALLEAAVTLSAQDWLLTVLMGLGPLGAAFFLWDAALKNGDARKIGILSYITPLASTVLLLFATGRQLTWGIGLATVLILGAAMLARRAK
jgi:drug/metabolite transporter (DMT)-like permease